MLLKFGTGSLYAVSDSAGSTPIQFGAIQDVSVDISYETKELHGQFQMPIAVARGTAKITGKAKFGAINGRVYNDLFFADTLATGQTLAVDNEAGIPDATLFQVTVANAATFVIDYGVIDGVTGLPLTKVTATPLVGEYSAAVGVYQFAATDLTLKKLSYTYTITTGSTIVVSNQLQGASPTFMLQLNTVYENKQWMCQLNRCMSSKLAIATKLGDWNIDELDFSAFADAAGNVMTLSLAE